MKGNKMLIQGTVLEVTNPDYQNNFGVQYQNITIQTVQGQIQGRIGTKKPYTVQDIGQQGQWDCEQAQNKQGSYNKFKKHYDNPYQGQQATQQGTGGTNSKPRDYDAENRGKVRTQFIKAAIIAGTLKCQSYEDVLTLTEFAMYGIDPSKAPEPHPDITEPQYNANPNYVGDNPTPPKDDDIPF